MPAPVVHFEIGCKDLAKTQSFYAAVFGWEFMAFGETTAMIGNLGSHCPKPTDGIGGHINSLGHPPHNYVTVYAQVDDIAATLAHIEKLGGKTLVPQQEVPGMGWFAWFTDPEGNALGLWKNMQPG
ncbi:MAG: VOC family protein [Phycisphaerales bacterium]|jgi:predicted enzyme related to lactoylglutathione lyase|nr:VOC family protein [Phycisphaerales bacterium]